MPGAKQLEWIDLIDKRTHRFKSAAELKKLFADAGVELDRPTAAHCQSGGRAAVMAFGLELMGGKGREELLSQLVGVGKRRRHADRQA